MAFVTSLEDCVTLDKRPGKKKLDLNIEKSHKRFANHSQPFVTETTLR